MPVSRNEVTYSPSPGDLFLPSITLVASGRAVFFTLINSIFIDSGSGRFETLPIYGIKLWRKSLRVSLYTGWDSTYAEEGIILFSPVIVTVCALYYTNDQELPVGNMGANRLVLTTSLKC